MKARLLYSHGGSPCHPEVADQCQYIVLDEGGQASSSILPLNPERAAEGRDFMLYLPVQALAPKDPGECFDDWCQVYEWLLRTCRQYDRRTAAEEIAELRGKQRRLSGSGGVPFRSWQDLPDEYRSQDREKKLLRLEDLASRQTWENPAAAAEAKQRFAEEYFWANEAARKTLSRDWGRTRLG